MFWLYGSSILNPLGALFEDCLVECVDYNRVQLKGKKRIDNNVRNFIMQGSNDGIIWNELAWLPYCQLSTMEGGDVVMNVNSATQYFRIGVENL